MTAGKEVGSSDASGTAQLPPPLWRRGCGRRGAAVVVRAVSEPCCPRVGAWVEVGAVTAITAEERPLPGTASVRAISEIAVKQPSLGRSARRATLETLEPFERPLLGEVWDVDHRHGATVPSPGCRPAIAPRRYLYTGMPALRIELADALDPLVDEWRELAESVDAAPFLYPEWFQAWWPAFGTGLFRVTTARRGERLVALAPMQTGRGVWRSPTN